MEKFATARFTRGLAGATLLAVSITCGSPTSPAGFYTRLASVQRDELSSQRQVASVSVSLERPVIPVGDSTKASALVVSATGRVLRNRTVTWTTGNPSIASVDSKGVVRGVAPGTATIVGTVGSVSGQATMTVQSPPLSNAATQLAMVMQPPSAALNDAVLVPAPAVGLRDATNQPVGQSGINVTATISSGSGTLRGTLTMPTDATGVATFRDLSIMGSGTHSIRFVAAGLTDATSAAITVTEPVGNAPACSEPPGFTFITDRQFDAKVESGWQDRGDTNFSIVSDPTAPNGAGTNVGQASYPAGWIGGSGPINTYFGLWNQSYRQLFVTLWVKLSDNWQGHSSGVNKLLFIWIHDGPTVFLNAQGSGAGPYEASLNLQGNIAGAVRLRPSVAPSAALMKRGEWYRWDVLLIANTPGLANGVAVWCINGQVVGNYTNADFSKLGQGDRWQEVSWNPTWGGAGDAVSSAINMRMDRIRIAGKP